MSLTRQQWIEIWNSLKTIERINKKVWKAKHYKWANDINWEVQKMKDQIQQVIGQQE